MWNCIGLQMPLQLNLCGATICHNGCVIRELGPTLKLATCSIVYKRSGRNFIHVSWCSENSLIDDKNLLLKDISLLGCVDWWLVIDVSKVRSAFIFGVKQSKKNYMCSLTPPELSDEQLCCSSAFCSFCKHRHISSLSFCISLREIRVFFLTGPHL